MALSKAFNICKSLEDSDLLEKPMPISLLDEIAYHLEEWEELAPYIELTEAEQEEIKNDYDKQYLLQKRQALRRWRKKGHLNATLEIFVSILCEQGLISLAEMVIKKSQVPPSCLLIFAKYLRHFYIHDIHHPANNQWPSLLEGFDLPALYVDLKFNKVPLNETKAGTTKAVEVELKEVFQENTTNRLVILFEGIAGSGKTTLSWHACREWADKKLLQQFDLLIHVQVNNPRLQNASSLRDLIPDPDKEARDEIAQAITDREGKGACVLLEGLDEASKNLRDFILSKMLHDKRLSRLSIIITSRPDSRLLLSLQKCHSARIVLNGFTTERLCEFLDSTMKKDELGRREVDKMFLIRPRFQALCTLPINAVVVSFLIQNFGCEFPVTQTDLFKLLVCHICIRHVQLRSGGTELHIERLPHDLPSDLRESFDKLCLLAYTASIEKKRALSLTDLRHAKFQDVDNKLGILYISQTKSMYGLSKNYTFPHFALQQFLAAVHISQQKNNKQISFIRTLVQQDPLDELLPFHAGLTNDKIRIAVIENLDCRMSLDESSIAEQIQKDPTVSNDPRRKFLALCKCLYECQNESLIEEVKLHPPRPLASMGLVKFVYDNEFEYAPDYIISFINMWLSPLECLAVAYFIRSKSLTLKTKGFIRLGFMHSSISGTSLSVLATELRRNVNHRTTCGILLRLEDNALSYQALQLVKQLLKGQSNIHGIRLQHCFTSAEIDKRIVLKHLIEGLTSNSSINHIGLGENGLNQSHFFHLVLLIMSCPQLQELDLSESRLALHSLAPLLSKAFSLSMLLVISLTNCDICDEVLFCLGEGICQNPYLQTLQIEFNPKLTLAGFMNFLNLFINEISNLMCIRTDLPIYLSVMKFGLEVIKNINDIRRRRNTHGFGVESPFCDPLAMQCISKVFFLQCLASRSRKQLQSTCT